MTVVPVLALVTGVWLFSRVSVSVCFEFVLPSESLPAVVTDMRPVVGAIHMLVQHGPQAKLLATGLAGVDFLFFPKMVVVEVNAETILT